MALQIVVVALHVLVASAVFSAENSSERKHARLVRSEAHKLPGVLQLDTHDFHKDSPQLLASLDDVHKDSPQLLASIESRNAEHNWQAHHGVHKDSPQHKAYLRRTSPPFPPTSQENLAPPHKFKVVMADSVVVDASQVPRLADATYSLINPLVNYLYAKDHGYDFVIYQYSENDGSPMKHKDNNGCPGLSGPNASRNLAWCKLLAMSHALKSVEHDSAVLWMDTDAHVHSPQISLETFWSTTPLENDTDCRQPEDAADPVSARHSDLLVAREGSYCGYFNTGMWLLKKTVRGRKLLKLWWNTPACAETFPYEQRAFHAWVYRYHPQGIAHLDIDIFQNGEIVPNRPKTYWWKQSTIEANLATIAEKDQDTNRFFLHVGHNSGGDAQKDNLPQTDRGMRDSRALLTRWNVTDENFGSIVEEFKKHIHVITRNELKEVADAMADTSLAAALDGVIKKEPHAVRDAKHCNDHCTNDQCQWVPAGAPAKSGLFANIPDTDV